MSIVGRSIVVCRATHQASVLLDALAEHGALPVHVPLIDIAAPEDGGVALRRAIRGADASTWLAFTSVNGVEAVAGVLEGDRPVCRIAAVGGATAERIRSHGWALDAVASVQTAAGLGASLPADPGDRVIAPLADLASTGLADALDTRGVVVDVVTAYRTVTTNVSDDELGRIEESDAVFITSPSVFHRLLVLMGRRTLPPLIAIGPTSAAAIRSAGLEVAGQAEEPSVDGLIEAAVRTLGP